MGSTSRVIEMLFGLAVISVFSSGCVSSGKQWPDGQLRGLCVGKPRKAMEMEKTYKRMSDWKVNVITVNFDYDKRLKDLDDKSATPSVPAKMAAYRGALNRLDIIVKKAAEHGIFVNICVQSAVGGDSMNVAMAKANPELKENAEKKYFRNAITLLGYIADTYKDTPNVIAYSFMPEPHTPWIVKNWQDTVVPEAIKTVRKVDTATYLIFSPGLWGFPCFDELKKPFHDPADRLIYGYHPYAPHNYTHQGIKNRPMTGAYPGQLKMFNSSPLKHWDKNTLFEYMKPAVEFKKKHGVKMFAGEFSVVRWAKGRKQWVQDMCELFDEYNIDWTYHSYTGWNGWNPTFPADAPSSNEPDGGVDTERLKVLKKFWAKNKVFFK